MYVFRLIFLEMVLWNEILRLLKKNKVRNFILFMVIFLYILSFFIYYFFKLLISLWCYLRKYLLNLFLFLLDYDIYEML